MSAEEGCLVLEPTGHHALHQPASVTHHEMMQATIRRCRMGRSPAARV
jgi:hypothetical protein